MTDPIPRRAEVWWADVPADKRRPVVILTRDPMGRYLHSVLCAPITSSIRGLTTEVVVGAETGLRHRSAVSCDNLVLVPRNRLLRRLGRCGVDQMAAVCTAISTAIGCSA